VTPVDGDTARTWGTRTRLARRALVTAVLGAVAVGAVIAPGFDEREVTQDNPSVWALQSTAGQRFARINTVVGEVDTVKEASAPTDIVQAGNTLLVYADNLGTVTPVDAAKPADLSEGNSQATVSTPTGTEALSAAGDWVAYLTDSGQALAGRVSDGTALTPQLFDPFANEPVTSGADRPVFTSAALAISPTGTLAAYAPDRSTVMRVNAESGEVEGMDIIVGGPEDGSLQMSWSGDTWLLFESATGRLWWRGGSEPLDTGVTGSARLQSAVSDAGVAYLADDQGLMEIRPADGTVTRVFGDDGTSLGDPAAPTASPTTGEIVAAWLPGGVGPGTLWSSEGGAVGLPYGGIALGDQRSPQLRTNGSRLILNENRSGWVWMVPSGELVASSQQWDPEEETPSTDDEEDVATEVTDPRAPIAEDDEFGVRAGRQVILPILLNDHDANKDVLTVWLETLGSLDPAFGTLSLSDDDQSLVVTVAPDASGSRSFTYQVTDGTASGGLLSEPATVTLTVVPESINTAPRWCGVDGCLATWPSPEVQPGGTVTADVLTGWVDPEGDPIYLAGTTTQSLLGVVASSPEGRFVFQHANANATGSATVAVDITVSDSWGATADKTLNIGVLDEPGLHVDDLSLTVTAGIATTVDVGDHVTGAVGSLQLTEASLAPGDDADVAVAQSVVGFTFRSDVPGSHLVDFKVSDGVAESRAVARITVVAPEQERLTTVPLTAFVRSKEDATIDVLTAVQNPGDRVLLLADAAVTPASDAQLSADVVGFSALRISGDTGDGQPGVLGVVKYTVSDGTGRPEMTATGEVTVILLPAQVPSAPLAVNDKITVRVGTQVDISVLANDIAPAGSVLSLDPDSVVNVSEAGLAFGAGSRVRYLAPNTPGTYTITYQTYVLGYPAQRAQAQVVVTVLDEPTNSAPMPRPLTGRVAAGQSVRLQFDGTGIDPDGDRVVLNRVEDQPSSGFATVSAGGRSIIYTSIPGFSGQVTFTYSVIDARGQTAIGTATVGVIAAELEARPVTYTDYVQAQVGIGRTVVVTPTSNDIDLAGGELEVVDVSPDANIESDEYRELADKVMSFEDNAVTLSVGEQPGTFAYLYTVRNATGSTAVGRIILKAVREPVADVPIVTDTVLRLATRDTLPAGVDVLTDKVSWASGDPAGLELSLWGDQPGFTVDGWKIAGPVTDEGRIIPFKVTGINFAGEEVSSYGFLTLPGIDEYRVALKDTFTQPQVEEGKSVTFDIAPMVDIPADAQLVVDPEFVVVSGMRPGSECEFVSGTTIRYKASEGQPFWDVCRIAARISSQDRYTVVPVPITIVPKAPSPILKSAFVEISPGATAVFDLANMVSWPEGATARPVDIAFEYSGQQFTYQREGTVLTVTAQDRAVPGNVDGATVRLTSDPEVPAVSLSFRVGPAPSLLPKGATVSRQCSQASGSSCTIDVIGGPGEVNPLPGTPLEIASVQPDPSCPGVTFTASGTSAITAWWTSDSPGATCTAVFTVKDAQGRISAGDRVGTLYLDLQGFPAAPAEVRQVAFGDTTLQLAVTGSATGVSYPAISGYAIYEGSSRVTTCNADGTCQPITGLVNGVKHTYTAKSVNSVGESRTAVSVVAWSYAPPLAVTNVTWTPTVSTGGEGKRIDIELDVVDQTTRELRITSPNGETKVVPVAGKGHRSISAYITGSNEPTTVTITPATNLDLPPIEGAQEAGAAVTFTANGVGAPTITGATPTVAADGLSVSIAVTTASGGAGSETWVGIVSGATCTGMVQVTGGTATVSTAVTPNIVNHVKVCAESRVGGTVYASASSLDVPVYPWVDPGGATITTGYRVATTCEGDGYSCTTGVTAPEIDLSSFPDTMRVRYTFDGGARTATFSNMPIGAPTVVEVYLCVVFGSGNAQCSTTAVTVPPEPGYADYRTQVSVASCAVGEAPSVSVGAAAGDYSLTWTLLDENGDPTTDFGEMRTARVTVNFIGALSGIDPWTSATMTCTGAPDPEPEPEPDPSVSPTP